MDIEIKLTQHPYDIHTVYANDFGDEYYDTTKREAVLKHNHYNIPDYINALEKYKKYMSDLKKHYGGKQLFQVFLKAGAVKESIPITPRLKKKGLMLCLEKGIVLSKVNKKELCSDFESISPIMKDNLEASDSYGRDIVNILSMSDDEKKSWDIVNRRNTIRAFAGMQSFDELEYFFKNRYAKSDTESETDIENMFLSADDILYREELCEAYNDYLDKKQHPELKHPINVVSKYEQDKELLNLIAACGWKNRTFHDIMRKFNSDVDDDDIKDSKKYRDMYRSRLDVREPAICNLVTDLKTEGVFVDYENFKSSYLDEVTFRDD
jgi:hypothetical protein